MKIVEKIVNVADQTEKIIEREATAEEIAEMKSVQAELVAQAEETAAKEAARQALLDKLGITADEAKLLLS